MKRFSIEYEGQATEHPFGPFALYKEAQDCVDDAKRYRFLKEQNESTNPCSFKLFFDNENCNLIPVQDMDSEIDALRP